jgi:hypothetical protein
MIATMKAMAINLSMTLHSYLGVAGATVGVGKCSSPEWTQKFL